MYIYILLKFHSQEEMHGPSQNLKHGHIFVVALCLVAMSVGPKSGIIQTRGPKTFKVSEIIPFMVRSNPIEITIEITMYNHISCLTIAI